MAHLTGSRRIAHLLRRAGFGASPEELSAYSRLGFDAAIDRLVGYERVPNDRVETHVAQMEEELELTRLASIQEIWLYRLLHTARPLEEKMTLFWHDHFATANYKIGRPELMYAQNNFFRTHALGSFRQILYGISRDPAMLLWLDSNANRKGRPNENYARELMELFSMGVDNYTEEDVREAARAFTGWFYDRNVGFVFNENQHDYEEKTFLGQTGDWDGDDIVNIILDQPITAEYMARKLFSFFVHDHPSPDAITRLAGVFRGSQYSIRELVQAILRSPEFRSDDAYHGLVKSPVEYLVGSMHALGIAEYTRDAAAVLRRMGMDLFNPPSVAGWDWGAEWIGAATLLERLNAANTLATLRGDNADRGLNPTALLERLGARTPVQIVEGLLDLLVDGDVPAAVPGALVDYMAGMDRASADDLTRDEAWVDRTVRSVAHLIMATPVYQMA